jgi:hypothetical protein
MQINYIINYVIALRLERVKVDRVLWGSAWRPSGSTGHTVYIINYKPDYIARCNPVNWTRVPTVHHNFHAYISHILGITRTGQEYAFLSALVVQSLTVLELLPSRVLSSVREGAGV